MTEPKRARLKQVVVVAAFMACGGTVFNLSQGNEDWTDYVSAIGIAVLLSVMLSWTRSWLRRWVRGDPFVLAVFKRSVAYLVVIAASFLPVMWLSSSEVTGTTPFSRQTMDRLGDRLIEVEFRIAVAYAFAGILVATFMGEISRKLGPGVLWNWLLGRYHRPRQEERVFMFLDLRGSTALAERLGPLRFSEFVREFFADVSDPIVESGGEVSHYIGDEVVVTWPLRRGLEQASCVRCFMRVRERLRGLEASYRTRFGEAPAVKAGLHCGIVVVTDVGEIKSEIVYHGDTVNTTSRIQEMCGALGRDLLISAELGSRLALPAGWQWVLLGSHALKGKVEPVELVGLEPTGQASDPHAVATGAEPTRPSHAACGHDKIP